MKSTVKELSQCKREIEVEIESSQALTEFEKILSQYSRKVRIPGFRPGKAPKDMVKRMFYPEIKESLVNSLAPKALRQEIKSQNLKPISAPVINDLHFKEGEPFRFRAKFEIWPQITLPDYKNIKTKKKKISITGNEINKSLEDLQLKASQYFPVEGRGVVAGDYVVVEIKGRDIKTKRFLPTEKVAVIADDPNNDKIFNQKLLALKPNEESNFVLTYRKDHKNKKLAGKKIEYKVRVISIKKRKIPEINDDFAKDLGEYENLKDLKAKIKKTIIASKEREIRKETTEEIIKNISDKLNVELPETLIEEEYMAILKKLLSSNTSQELKKEEIEKLKVEGRKKAKENIKNHLILKKIAEEEKLEVSEDEVHEELKAIAEANNLPLVKVIQAFNKEGKREELRESILFKKTVDFLVDKAIIE